MTTMAEQAPSQLSDLVSRRRDELRLSYDRLAQRCVDPETGEQEVKSSWLHRLETHLPVLPPQLPQLRALAAGLQLPLRQVQDAAAAQFMGIQGDAAVWSEDGTVRAVVARMGEMSADGRRELAKIADVIERERRNDT